MIKVYYDDSIVKSFNEPDEVIKWISGEDKSGTWIEDLDIHLILPNSMIRVIDYDTLLKCRGMLISYVETAYYSGQEDGSFTLFDSDYFEAIFPSLYSTKELDNENVLSQISAGLDADMNVKLVSANQAVLMGVFSIVDTLFFLNERPSYLYVKNPQRDSLEFLISHIAIYDLITGSIKKVRDLDELFTEVFSDKVRTNIDMNKILGGDESDA